MSKPIPGDVVLAMAFPESEGGVVGPAFVVAVHDANVIDAMVATPDPNGRGFISWAGRLGLTEVSTVSEINGGVLEAPGVPFVPGTWCRREVCG